MKKYILDECYIGKQCMWLTEISNTVIHNSTYTYIHTHLYIHIYSYKKVMFMMLLRYWIKPTLKPPWLWKIQGASRQHNLQDITFGHFRSLYNSKQKPDFISTVNSHLYTTHIYYSFASHSFFSPKFTISIVFLLAKIEFSKCSLKRSADDKILSIFLKINL